MADDGARLFDELMRFKPEGLTPNGWAVEAGVGRTIWADLRRHGNPSRRTLSKLLEAAGSSLAEFEALRVRPALQVVDTADALAEPRRGWGQAPQQPLPLLSVQSGGRWGAGPHGINIWLIDRDRIVDLLPRPPSLASDRDGYAVTIVGDSMWPRFRLGRRVAVAPAASVSTGDDVLVMLANGGGALIGELQLTTAHLIRLRQFNPSAEFDVKAADVEAIHKVVGELI